MSKLAIALLLAVAISAQGAPTTGDEITAAAAAGNWEEVKRLIQTGFGHNEVFKPLSSGSVRDLKPPPGGHVYGEAQYTFHTSSNINGQTSEKSGGHKVVNDNGKVSEYDINPSIYF